MADKRDDPEYQMKKFVRNAMRVKGAVFLGVDPGASGAVAMRCGPVYAVFSIPAMKVSRSGKTKAGKAKSKTVFSLPAIVNLFRMLIPLRKKKGAPRFFAIIEEATMGIPGKGNAKYTAFRIGCNYAMWPLFLMSMGFSLEEVRPNIWKKKMGLNKKDKEFSRSMAQRMFPDAPLHRKKDHDRAEALLLVEYLRRSTLGRE